MTITYYSNILYKQSSCKTDPKRKRCCAADSFLQRLIWMGAATHSFHGHVDYSTSIWRRKIDNWFFNAFSTSNITTLKNQNRWHQIDDERAQQVISTYVEKSTVPNCALDESSFNTTGCSLSHKETRQWYWLVWYQWIDMIVLDPALPNRYQYPKISRSYDVITKYAIWKIIVYCNWVLSIGGNLCFYSNFLKN